MISKIEIVSPFRRYGDRIINLNFVEEVNICKGDIWLAGGGRLIVPVEVAMAWFCNYSYDYAKMPKNGGQA